MNPQRQRVFEQADVIAARQIARSAALEIGFSEQQSEEIVLVAGELASNLVHHAGGGMISFSVVDSGLRSGIEIETRDQGPGIPYPDLAVADGYSTRGSLGYGLGTVNRLMDELEIKSPHDLGSGSQVTARRWLRPASRGASPCPLDLSAASRPYPGMRLNGDAFVIHRGESLALVGVIDGLGHGQYAHRAAIKAREYVERHYDQPMISIFRGANRACQATRGAVMALAQIEWQAGKLTFATIGNIEARLFGPARPARLLIRRGVIGLNAPAPAITETHWSPSHTLIMHSDGLSTRWQWEDLAVGDRPASEIAHDMLRRLAKDHDDATVLVVKGER